MSYISRKGSNMTMMGFGDASSCGPDQVWYPNLVYLGIKGQCSTPQAAAASLASGQASGNLSTTPDGSGGPSIWDKLIGGVTDVFKAKVTPGSTTIIQQPSGGIGTTGMVAIGAAGLLAVVLLTRKKS